MTNVEIELLRHDNGIITIKLTDWNTCGYIRIHPTEFNKNNAAQMAKMLSLKFNTLYEALKEEQEGGPAF